MESKVNMFSFLVFICALQVSIISAGLGTGCVNSSWCTIENSYCSPAGFCRCRPEFTEISGACYSTPVPVEGPCTNDAHCPLNGFCDSNKSCKCQPEFISSINKTTCLRLATNVGQECKDNSVCSQLANSECFDGCCVCSTGHVPSKEQTSCLKMAVHLNDVCEENIQCTTLLGSSSSICSQSKCFCKYGYVNNQSRNQCHAVVDVVGGTCVINEQCQFGLGKAECIQSICQCTDDALPNESQNECVSF